jgi:hypothetical protein
VLPQLQHSTTVKLIYHFIKGNMFCCPVCHTGETNVCFQRTKLPPAILKRLELMEDSEAKKKCSA